uniref:Intraflagellar transport protein 140 homolog n=1 Tax=Timema monikensis TaxID=170555 RepID=A0A7R9DZP4_9NEOP|nr:unnamed protein product [Timema monikensis]
MHGLAKAAVAGDERALDLFSAWRPRTAGQRIMMQAGSDNLCFYVSSITGVLFYFNEEGTCTEVLNTDGSMLKKLLFHERKDCLIVMTEGLNIGQFNVDSKGNLSEVMKVKLSGRSQETSMVWAGPGLVAVTTGDMLVRCLDLDTGENYLLETTSPSGAAAAPAEAFTSLAYCSQKRVLCGGTNLGNIVMWKYSPPLPELDLGPGCSTSIGDPSKGWVQQTPCSVPGAIKFLSWAHSEPLLAVNTIIRVYVLKEQTLSAHYSHGVSAVQVSPSNLLVEVLSEDSCPSLGLKTDLQVSGVSVCTDHVVVWSSKTLVVYQLNIDTSGEEAKLTANVAVNNLELSILGSFACEADAVYVYEQSVVVLQEERIQIRTFQGTVKQTLPFTDLEGQPIFMQLCGHFLVVATSCGIIKIWDLARRLSNFLPDTKLFLWDIESDSLQYFNFSTGRVDDGENEEYQNSLSPELTMTSTSMPGDSLTFDCLGRFVLSHQWDAEEPKLVVCEAKLLPKKTSNVDTPHYSRRMSSSTVTMPANTIIKKTQGQEGEVVLVTFFTCPEVGLIVQDVQSLPENHHKLLGVCTPHYLLLSKPSSQLPKVGLVKRMAMRDFEGLESCDKATREAVLNFSYNMTTGNMDEAFRAIKTIRRSANKLIWQFNLSCETCSSEVVWESLAKMCVKTKRLDVASVCLGHMKHARGAMALRQAAHEPVLEARVAMLAVHLGLMDEAERLYELCGRYDRLNALYQAAGEWDKAMRVAEEHDRIHLRATCHNYASYLEGKGDTAGAARMYERADTHRSQVPRMLIDDPAALQTYVSKTKDVQLTKWWGQYMESTGRMDEAIECYEKAGDYFSLVRILCFQEDLTRAAQVASTTGDKAACYHLARRYESQGRIQEAVHFFTIAQAYGNAVRICRIFSFWSSLPLITVLCFQEHGLEEGLWNLALLAGPREQLEAAQYFEQSDHPLPEKSVLLYHRAGMLHKALDLAFRTQQYSALQLIALDLNSTSDPVLIAKCAKFFVDNKQFDKAVDLLAVGKQYEEALALCVEHDIPVTEDLAEKLTMVKGEGDEGLRVRVLESVAESALAQRNYHLATKKFTQAGNKVRS